MHPTERETRRLKGFPGEHCGRSLLSLLTESVYFKSERFAHVIEPECLIAI